MLPAVSGRNVRFAERLTYGKVYNKKDESYGELKFYEKESSETEEGFDKSENQGESSETEEVPKMKRIKRKRGRPKKDKTKNTALCWLKSITIPKLIERQ